MGDTFSFVSVKGGVGKTALALETSSCLANDFSKRVLLVDANFSAPNLGIVLGLKPELDVTLHDALLGVGLHNAIYEKHGFDVVPAAIVYREEVDPFRLKKVLSRVKNRYDFIILDSSPHYGEMIPVIAASDRVFVVTTPDLPTLSMSVKASKLARERNTPVEGILINRIRDPKHEISLKEIEEAIDVPVIARIHDDKGMVEALHKNIPIGLHDKNNKISKEIKRFAAALCGEGEKQGILNKIWPFGNSIGKEKVNREILRKKFYEEVF